jgi:hypothetical protein
MIEWVDRSTISPDLKMKLWLLAWAHPHVGNNLSLFHHISLSYN